MIYHPEKYRIKDERMKPFIDADEIWDYLNNSKADKQREKAYPDRPPGLKGQGDFSLCPPPTELFQ